MHNFYSSTEPPEITTTELIPETTTFFDYYEDYYYETTTFIPETTTITSTTTSTTKAPKKNGRKVCRAQGVWKFTAGFDDWCDQNCNHRPPYCPPSHCKCQWIKWSLPHLYAHLNYFFSNLAGILTKLGNMIFTWILIKTEESGYCLDNSYKRRKFQILIENVIGLF